MQEKYNVGTKLSDMEHVCVNIYQCDTFLNLKLPKKSKLLKSILDTEEHYKHGFIEIEI